MSLLAQTLAEFGRDIGVGHLQEREEGGVQLRLESGDVFGVQVQGEEVVVHYAQVCSFDAPSRLLKAMKLAHGVDSDTAMVQVGLRETAQSRWLVVAQRRPCSDFGVQQMHQVLARLRDFLQQTNI